MRDPCGKVANFLNRDTTIIGLPAGVLATTSTLPSCRETNIIVLGKRSNHHICLRFRSGWNRIIQTACLEKKFATQTDEMTLRDSRKMNYDSKLQNMSWLCYKHVNTLS